MPHKNVHRAPLKPLNIPTLALSSLGIGFLRPAPGTLGSIPPAALAWLMLMLGAGPLALNITIAATLVVSSILCVLFGEYAEKRFGRKDAAEVVIDETAGVSLPLLFLPAGAFPGVNLLAAPDTDAIIRVTLIAGGAFLLFRLFDIVKPPPVRTLEKLHAGWGVLIDDLVAGIYALLVMQLVLRFII